MASYAGTLSNDTYAGGTGPDTVDGLAGDDLHAWSGGVSYGGGITITQEGSSTVIALDSGNFIVLSNTVATSPAFLGHILW